MTDLEGRTVLITGGASGIGAAAAIRLREVGARVFISDVREPHVGSSDAFIHHDVTSTDSWRIVVSQILDDSGRLDGLVNSAGIFRPGMTADTPLDTWNQVVGVNQTGIFLGMQACVDALAENGGGAIVNLTSYAGMQGHGTSIAYQATKWAVRGMTRFAAREFAPRSVRVNALVPGFIDTPMVRAAPDAQLEAIRSRVPMLRFGEPREAADAIHYLISDQSSYLTGAELVIDGGLLA